MSQESVNQSCPLCFTEKRSPFHQDRREYFYCPTCHLVFVPPKYFLSPKEEQAQYNHHENSVDDPRYRSFLGRLFTPLSERIVPGSNGLDFGSGPGPTLSVMFEEAGHKMAIYDPFYAPDLSPLQQQYDFITASEVVEHLHQPRQELDRLWSCLKQNGFLGVMTKRVINRQAFSSWHYKNDPTHVCFFSLETFQWLANRWSATLTVSGDDVVLFQKSNSSDSD
ncbi:class I SAM-dependent methyltransferase [Gimesia aquarii]|uniref:Methyltransferase domain protein n=1 Tax=Gimesia aquarii TaxID=2527964 RepID=A0A517VSJ4_9PLAN|nr:class I SAM-dependent methyltransferase [Gimesia aquarii]QDT95929.1 hypothetical protein V144x_13780 [Gimesia aquarii]